MVLLAYVCMLRPKDLWLIRREDIKWTRSGCQITLFGHKTDKAYRGSTVSVHYLAGMDWIAVCAASCLKEYLLRTLVCKPSKCECVWLSQVPPHKPLSKDHVASICKSFLCSAGYTSDWITARSLRSSGASHAIQQKVDPHVVMQLGRWNNPTMFWKHYVHSQLPEGYSEQVMGLQNLNSASNLLDGGREMMKNSSHHLDWKARKAAVNKNRHPWMMHDSGTVCLILFLISSKCNILCGMKYAVYLGLNEQLYCQAIIVKFNLH